MLVERRRHKRYSLTLTAQRINENGLISELRILELSVGGCFLQWFAGAEMGDSFRLKIPLDDNSFLPVLCKVIYRFPNSGIGVKFVNLTQFEEELIAKLIFAHARQDNLVIKNSLELSDSFK